MFDELPKKHFGAIGLTPMQNLVFKTIKLRGKAGVSCDRLLAVLDQYRNVRRLDPPKNPRKIIHVTVNQINKTLGRVIIGEMGGDRLYHCNTTMEINHG